MGRRGDKMSREARRLSKSGFYHVVFRGINHQNIFEEEQDFEYMLEIIKKLKQEMQFEIHAYCLMANHVHILLKEAHLGDISTIIKRLLTKYVMKFNKKYQRSGALIGSRYKSKVVEIDEYFIPLIVYIHQNPLKAGIVRRLESYKYSSFNEYRGKQEFVDIKLSLEILGMKEWIKAHEKMVENEFEVEGRKKLNEQEIRQIIIKNTNNIEPHKIGSFEIIERNKILRKLKKLGLSIREIERVTGISRGIIARC